MNWIFIESLQHFRLHDFIRDYGFVEFRQKDKVQVGDIVYLYITAPYKRVEYKMVVERINISSHDAFDDRAYSLLNKPTTLLESDKVVRLKYVDRVQTNDLSYQKLREHGFAMTMQTNRLLNEETANYIECFFK
jgi:5-methylcytosine-specific restriction protein A